MIRGGGSRDLAGSGGVNVFPWEHTLTHCHIPLCNMQCPSLRGLPTLSKTRNTQWDTASLPLFHAGNLLLPCCTAILLLFQIYYRRNPFFCLFVF